MTQKYTVVIPVRDGAETIEYTLKTCLRQKYPNFEIIVSDNCSTDETRSVVQRLGDPRIRYVAPERRLSMSGNFEFALQHVDRGFVMYMGADDGIMPGAIEYVDELVRRHRVEAVSCQQATYVWPTFPDANVSGRLVFGGLRNDTEVRFSADWLAKTLSFECQFTFELPNLYCGFVHTDVLHRGTKDGKYFRSITPDAYAAFAIAIFVDRYAYSHAPFVVAGASRKSTGASTLNPQSSSAAAQQFQAENDIEFHRDYVHCPSFEVLAAEAFAQVADTFPERCRALRVDLPAMCATSVSRSNSKTAPLVRTAIDQMAQRHNIHSSDATRPTTIGRRPRLAIVMMVLKRLFAVRSRYVAIRHSSHLHVDNIDDAVLAAQLLSQVTVAPGVDTTRDLASRIIRSRLPWLASFRLPS